MEIKKIGIIGAGTMGNGIAQAFAVCGYAVTMTDISESAVQRGLKTVDGSLERLVKKDKMTADAKAAALGLISTATDMGAVRGSDLLIEAATENLELKLKIFAQLAELAGDGTILATGMTEHAAVTRDGKPRRLPAAIKQRLMGVRENRP